MAERRSHAIGDREERNWLSHDGAHELARRIRAFWVERGAEVRIRVEPFSTRDGERIFALRSNLGLCGPPSKTETLLRDEAALAREQRTLAEQKAAALEAELLKLQASKQEAAERAKRAMATASELRRRLEMATAGPANPPAEGAALLDAIRNNPDLPCRELAPRLGVSASKVWRARQRLEAEATASPVAAAAD